VGGLELDASVGYVDLNYTSAAGARLSVVAHFIEQRDELLSLSRCQPQH
jgi:hypothetical protein